MTVVVVKLGGEVLTSEALPDVARELVTLQKHHPTVVVHGGGPEITRYMEALDLPVPS